MSKKGYTNIDNEIFLDNRLSWKAKGIYCQLKALPDTWEYSKAGLLLLSRDGIRVLDYGIKELKRCGYLDIVRERKQNGQLCYKYILKKPQPP